MAKSYRAGLTVGEIASYPFVPNCRYRLKDFAVNWFRRGAFGFHAGEWLALAIVLLLSFALCIALSKLVWWLHTRKREADEGEKEYWRIHG
jgi:hypothetical protein